jgi:hypothetical protein
MLRHITESNETRKQKIKKTKQNEAKNYRQEIDKDESETCTRRKESKEEKPKTERSISLALALVHTHTHTHTHIHIRTNKEYQLYWRFVFNQCSEFIMLC